MNKEFFCKFLNFLMKKKNLKFIIGSVRDYRPDLNFHKFITFFIINLNNLSKKNAKMLTQKSIIS
ncbi:hypothetical protein BpHYR1_021248 [Brachionus plicatilis]|uniref:Uncharacterized protein n=1 Tax=Brachionus plicatilis TaxID=10195 RepID=A0A3M7T5F1_BRAPC|nr:hypothetical protein BpHYR1_021248 [Brachionus plicatilis]